MKKTLATCGLAAAAGAQAWASNAEQFREHDPIGWIMSIIAMGVVFVALVVLFLCFKYGYSGVAAAWLKVRKSFHRKQQLEIITGNRQKAQARLKITDASGQTVDDAEVAAAIAAALFLHDDGMHDHESGVITLAPPAPQAGWTGPGHNHKRAPQRKF